MKRATISALLASRIEHLMETDPSARTGTVGPQHDPYACLDARISVRSALGRFLTKKGYVGKELGASTPCRNNPGCYTVITVHLDRATLSPKKEQFLRIRSVSV